MKFILIFIIGSMAGLLGGLVGIGGGILIVPALVWSLGFTQKSAQGTTLAAMIPPIGIAATYVYYKAGDVDMIAAFWIALGFIAGGYFGANIAESISSQLLERVFGGCMIVIGIYMIYRS
ncbi:sulfite exporter TauE/SafE domain protein [Leptospira broomii serovar Hurstbridge str. 5399]|uniref:Probable membrane transporter protein n=1 Tax=Leptospira broomii serovar Hurstbridge str. 5399 TaxID=1049789 RepID=T0F7V3_9LEPT|nr:sulfite exporter TauE/SafE family protein [Leptospira broomii]EQA47195.1 sulfite exporter TauE/SafE domain protein [Leptospira broomii serovar Hurstbridge str. 5399]